MCTCEVCVFFIYVSEIHRKVASKQVTRGSISAVTLGTTGPIIETTEESRSCCRKQWSSKHHLCRDASSVTSFIQSNRDADPSASFQYCSSMHTCPLPLDSVPLASEAASYQLEWNLFDEDQVDVTVFTPLGNSVEGFEPPIAKTSMSQVTVSITSLLDTLKHN